MRIDDKLPWVRPNRMRFAAGRAVEFDDDHVADFGGN